jgi:hypothetical protein
VNFIGYQPQAIPRFGSAVQSDDVTEQPLGIASDVQNCAYRAQSVRPRDGIGVKLTFGAGNGLGGIGVVRYLAADNSGQENITVIAQTQDGNIWGASPFLQSSVKQLTDSAMVAASGLILARGLSAQCAQAYNKMIVAQGDLMTGKAPALMVDGATLACDPLTDKPFGDTWRPLTFYRVGNVVSPTSTINELDAAGVVQNLYYCTQSGNTAASEPIWPENEGGTVTDGTGVGNVQWMKLTILCSAGLPSPSAPAKVSTAAGYGVPAGSTLFLACTWTNQYGESLPKIVNPDGSIGNVLQFTNNTLAAVSLTVLLPPIPADIAALPPQYQPLTCKVYGYITAGVPNSVFYLDPTSYAYMGVGTPGQQFVVNAVAIGGQVPQQNNAFSTPIGNVASGTRYMIVLYMDRMGYICGWAGPAPIRGDISADSRMLLVQNLPIGPYNCVARICAFTVAGQGSAGPYFYIYQDDFADPGLGAAPIKQTATMIPDNTTTSAYFDFIDTYLTGATNVTDYLNRIQLPFCSDAYFSKTLNRVIYGGCIGYPSGFLVSDLEDPGAIRVPGSIVQVSQTDGDRTVCWRESGTQQIAYKENSVHSVTPSDGDPSDWAVNQIWRGSGPCGPRAIDSATTDGVTLTAFAHRTGGYMWVSGPAPTLLTKELTGTPEMPGYWDRINWAKSQLIRTCINVRERLIYFFVPLDGSLVNNYRITVNYFYGTDDPVIFIVRTGREVPNISGRKWSLDSIAGNDAIYVPQRTS